MKRPFANYFAFTIALTLAAAPHAGCRSEPAVEGAFVVRLGTDTVAVESYTRSGDRHEATAVIRTPRTRVRQSVVAFTANGGIERYESTVRDAGTPAESPPAQRIVMAFGRDAATVETTRDGETETSTMPATPEMIPSSFDHFSLEELVIRQARSSGRDTVYRPGEPPSPVVVREIGPDSVALETEGLGTWRARVDAAGRIVGMQAGALGRTIERVPALDVDALAQRWADEDARGVGMGPLSPRDTVQAQVRGARITIDYSRPAKRGRLVFGGLVPWNEVWRTGANVATHFSTDRMLDIGGTRVPAGTYTLFTIPRTDGWTLIVNRQTGQPGTDYDPAQDLARLAMEVLTTDEPVERFTIAVEETAQGGVLVLSWERTRASVPFSVVQRR